MGRSAVVYLSHCGLHVWVEILVLGFSGGASGKEPACQRRRRKRHGFIPWIKNIPWRRAWQPTPVFLPEESHGHRNLEGNGLWGCKELDVTESLTLSLPQKIESNMEKKFPQPCIWTFNLLIDAADKLDWKKEKVEVNRSVRADRQSSQNRS